MLNKIELIKASVENKINIIHIKVNCFIIPKILIKNEKKYEIIKIPYKFIINKYEIKLKNGYLESIMFKNPHPNKNPVTNIFCIQEFFKQNLFEIDSDLEIIEHQFLTYNYNTFYKSYWNCFEFINISDPKNFSFRIHKEKQKNNKRFIWNINGYDENDVEKEKLIYA
jgi:hypothetical protein